MRICAHHDERLAGASNLAQSACSKGGCHIQVTRLRLFPDSNFFCLRFAKRLRALAGVRCFDACRPFNRLDGWKAGCMATTRAQGKRSPRKVSCDECYFRCNLLCALDLDEPCATFRPNEAQLRPPQQLRFVFRQEHRSRAAWAFPSAQEQAALHA
jgi:hypothetical protein